MTTTGMFQGLGETNRSSSRVLRPPGGISNNIFGTDEPECKQAAVVTINKDNATRETGTKDTAAGMTISKDTATSQNRLFGGDEPEQTSPADVQIQSEIDPKTAAGVQNRTGSYNPITGEQYADQRHYPRTRSAGLGQRFVSQVKAAPQPRQRQPPGGASSGLW